MMKIGIDATPLSRPDGGIRQYTRRLLHALRNIDTENEYVLLGNLQDDFNSWNSANSGSEGFRKIVEQKLLPIQRLDRRQIDLFHGTNYFSPLLETLPTILTIHDLSVHLFPGHHPVFRRLRHRTLPRMCRRARRLIADSHNTKNDLVRHYGVDEQKIDVIHLAAGDEFSPVICDQTRKATQERYSLPEKFLLFVGKIEPRKNLQQLIAAVASLKGTPAFTPLVLGGQCNSAIRKELLAFAQKEGLRENIDLFLPGYILQEGADVSQCG